MSISKPLSKSKRSAGAKSRRELNVWTSKWTNNSAYLKQAITTTCRPKGSYRESGAYRNRLKSDFFQTTSIRSQRSVKRLWRSSRKIKSKRQKNYSSAGAWDEPKEFKSNTGDPLLDMTAKTSPILPHYSHLHPGRTWTLTCWTRTPYK